MIILDGLGDRPLPILKNQTPLEAAKTPNLDALARRGMTGMMDPLSPGIPVSTSTGVGALMGLPAPHGLLARGPIEAAGVGLSLESDDVAFRCNFGTVSKTSEGFRIRDRRAGRIASPETHLLAESLSQMLGVCDGVEAVVRAATGHRAVLQLKGEALSDQISDVDPGDGWEMNGVLLSHSLSVGESTAERTANVVNQLVRRSYEILSRHSVNQNRRDRGLPEANILLPRRAGKKGNISGITQMCQVQAAVVAGESTVIGLGRLLKMDCVTEQSFTGNSETDLDGKVAAAQRLLERCDLVFLHIKGTDIYAHDRDGLAKSALLTRIDQALTPFLAQKYEDCVIAVCSDHSTPCATGRHSGDSVPVMLVAPEGRRDAVTCFGESSCMAGGLGRMTANNLLWSLLDQMGFVKNYRASSHLPLSGVWR